LEDSNAGTLYLKVVELEDSAKELGETVARLFNENCLLREDLATPHAESEEVVAKLGQLKVSHFFFFLISIRSSTPTFFFLCSVVRVCIIQELCERYKTNYEAERRKNVELLQVLPCRTVFFLSIRK